MTATPSLVPVRPAAIQPLLRLASGLLVSFAACGFGAWFSGVTSWVGFYLGARGTVLTGLAQASVVVGVVLAVAGQLAWYRRRCRRGRADIPAAVAAAACLALPAGNVCWAIFVDAIAWHYGQDLVRPAFDVTVMYVILGGLPPLTLGVPLVVSRWAASTPTAEGHQARDPCRL
jgi:hypothetical protein